MPASGKTLTRVKQEPGLIAPSAPAIPGGAAAGRIKTEPGSERLTSFRVPRDLTLGGIHAIRSTRGAAANKKVYTPNLNAVRNKNADVKTSRDTSATGRGRGRGDRRSSDTVRGGRGGKTSALVQTSGLFSEGSGEAKIRRSSVFDRNAGAGDSASALRRPTLVKREVKLDPAVEQKHIQDVLGDLDHNEDMSQLDGDPESKSFTPIALHEIKSEKPSVGSGSESTAADSFSYPQSLEEFFVRQQQQMFILQLPDSLPGHGPDEEPGESAAADNNAPTPTDPTAKYCAMRHLDDGLLGKIVRYKSGKTKLVIGESRFDITLGMEPGLLQEVMSVQTQPNSKHGDLINLGRIQAKLSAIPDWEYMFDEADKVAAANSKKRKTAFDGSTATASSS